MSSLCRKATRKELEQHWREEAMLEQRREARSARPCPWQSRHVSAWPGYGRELCPCCQRLYIHKREV